MSKKDKSKFRKRLKAQILQDIQMNQDKPQANVTPADTTPSSKPAQPSSQTPETNIQTSRPLQRTVSINPDQSQNLDSTTWIKKDLRKSAIIIGSIILVIVALTLLETKTGLLLQAGNFLLKSLHIGA